MRPGGQGRAWQWPSATAPGKRCDDYENLVVPDDLARALDDSPKARGHWEAFPRSAKRANLEWIGSAKREETRARAHAGDRPSGRAGRAAPTSGASRGRQRATRTRPAPSAGDGERSGDHGQHAGVAALHALHRLAVARHGAAHRAVADRDHQHLLDSGCSRRWFPPRPRWRGGPRAAARAAAARAAAPAGRRRTSRSSGIRAAAPHRPDAVDADGVALAVDGRLGRTLEEDRVDPDEPAVPAHERSAGVARVERRVGLHEVEEARRIGGRQPQRGADRGHHARGRGQRAAAGGARRVAERHHLVALGDIVLCAQRQRLRSPPRLSTSSSARSSQGAAPRTDAGSSRPGRPASICPPPPITWKLVSTSRSAASTTTPLPREVPAAPRARTSTVAGRAAATIAAAPRSSPAGPVLTSSPRVSVKTPAPRPHRASAATPTPRRAVRRACRSPSNAARARRRRERPDGKSPVARASSAASGSCSGSGGPACGSSGDTSPRLYSPAEYASSPLALGTFIGVGRSLETALQRVELAERLGYEAVYVTHIAGRDSVTTLMAYASRSERIRLGTGVMPIYSRTPVATAQSFATLDEFSGGRAVCGLGVSHRPVVEAWYGQTIDKPLRETREYVGVVRAIFARRGPARGREVPLGLSLHGLRRPGRPADLPGRRSRPRCSRWRARSPTAWCSGSATRTTCATWWCPRSARDARRRASRSKGFDIVAAVPSA